MQARLGAKNTASVTMDKVAKVFDSGDGVRDVSLDVRPGTILGFIGPSGSGKTTTVRMLTGALQPSAGFIRVLGEDPAHFTNATRSRIGYLPQRSVLYPNLSVGENLRFFASLYGLRSDAARQSEILEFVELGEHRSKRVADTSGGMQRRLSLASALVHDPDLILLDEPTAGIDPVLRRKMWDHFEELREAGRTLFVTTQYVGEAAYCDEVGVLADGELIMVDSPAALRRAAFGGEVIDVHFETPPPENRLDELRRIVDAQSWRILDLRTVRLTVVDASTAMPALGAWAATCQPPIASFEQYFPAFDDVFVELIESHRRSAEAVPTGRVSEELIGV